MKHGYAAVAASAVLIWAQVAVYDHYFLSEDTPMKLAHHARQLPALVPKLLLDVGLILLMGPSPTATPSDRAFRAVAVCSVLPHGTRAWATMTRHASANSNETLVAMLTSFSTMAFQICGFLLCGCGHAYAWTCFRSLNALWALMSIALCVVVQLRTGSSPYTEFPPCRGSFEGAIATYACFFCTSLWWTPDRRLWAHRTFTAMVPERWLPLSALGPEELNEFLQDKRQTSPVDPVSSDGSNCDQADRAGEETNGTRARRNSWSACGLSTLGSNSEVEDLLQLHDEGVLLPSADAAVAPETRRIHCEEFLAIDTSGLPGFAPSFLKRQRALEETLKRCGLSPHDMKSRSESCSSEDASSCNSGCSGSKRFAMLRQSGF